MKVCTSCRKEHLEPERFFSMDRQKKGGLSPICKACVSAKARAYYLKKRALLGASPRDDTPVASGSKRCSKCKTVYAASTEFFHRSTACKGLARWCKNCERTRPSAQRKTPIRFIDETHRECSKCSQVKTYAEFPTDKRSPWGISCYCRKCATLATKASNAKHRDARVASAKNRLAQDPATHMKYRLLGLVRKAIDRHALAYPVSSVTREFWQAVGYTRVELAEHLEQQFLPGMTWENRRLWHIDHIVPVSYFKPTSFSDPKFLACWGLNNLRPLWAADNIRKRDSLEFLHMLE